MPRITPLTSSSRNEQTDIFIKIVTSDGFAKLMQNYGTLIGTILSVGTIVVIICLAISAVKLSKSGDSPNERKHAQEGIMVSGVCLAFIGAFDFLFIIVWNIVLGVS